jgi:hypothetical protein
MYSNFARIGVKVQMNRVGSTQSLGDKRYLFKSKEFAHKLRISFSNGEHVDPLEYIGAAKRLGDKPSSIASELHHLVDKKFHRVHSAPGTSFSTATVWQQNMIHAAGTQYRIVQANRYARAQ